jgi:hypothetical protein
MLCSPLMDYQQPFALMIRQQVLQELREPVFPQLGAYMVVGASGQRGYGAIDMPFRLVIPGGDLRHLVHQAPLGGRRRMATHGRFIHKEQLPPLGLLLYQRLPLGHKGVLLLRLGLQMTVPQAAQAKSQRVQQLSDLLPAVLTPNRVWMRCWTNFVVHKCML